MFCNFSGNAFGRKRRIFYTMHALIAGDWKIWLDLRMMEMQFSMMALGAFMVSHLAN